MLDHSPRTTRAWVLHPDITAHRHRRAADPALEEAVSLAAALPGLKVCGAEIVPLAKTRPGFLFGVGKIEDLAARFGENDIELVLVDGPLTPVQQRNLEHAWKVKILDRTGLILEIFADRARTREGVLQVDLAALSYQRTRLVRAWTHLERQRGGLGFVGGPGETQIEADRRAIDESIARLRRQLAKVVKTRDLHRAARRKIPFPTVALVGYTNAGKSTLFNRLTGAEVMAKDMLFATLDPTMRGLTLPSGQRAILSDTVGFISDLPTQLVAAFRATLEDVLEADVILHVRDISAPETDAQARDVEAILQDLGVAEQVPVIEVWNKLDQVGETRVALETRAERQENVFALSALTGEGIAPLLSRVSALLTAPRAEKTLHLGFDQGRARAWLHAQEVVIEESSTEEGYILIVRWTERQESEYRALRSGDCTGTR
ncbi:GTPase HflX [Rhodovulum imhoffii]|nr:GTPase HflX [Rhodovulum imhoffii]